MATHPACINSTASAETQEAVSLFRDYLLEAEAQQLAVKHGLRPVNPAIQIGAPLDAAHGVDLSQPKVRFNAPSVDTVYAVQDVWQAARKDVNLVMLLDTSGSMRGDKVANMREAAVQFMGQMGDDDYITLVTFSDQPITHILHKRVGEVRDESISTIRSIDASGKTALYDAIGHGANVISLNTSTQATNVLVVLTDGQDTSSYQYRLGEELIKAAAANDTTVFTIAYGNDADENLLSNLAANANGNFYLGNEANISAIYQEMSAAFGGSVGIGR